MQKRAGPLRVALIGYGYVGQTFHGPLIAAEKGLVLQRVASRKEDVVQTHFPHVMVDADPWLCLAADDVDVVVIASPNDTHAPLALAALKAGKHVVVDKPFTLNVETAREVVAQAQHSERVLSVFHNRRWDSDFLSIKGLVEAGAIGEVVHFESHFDRFRPHVRDRWREGAGPGSGVWFDLGPHLIDQALMLFGMPERVSASLGTLRPRALAADWAHVVLEYARRRVVLQASMLVAGGSSRFTVHGMRGSVVKQRADQQEAQLLAGMSPGADGWGHDDEALSLYDGEGHMTQHVAQAGDQRKFYEGFVAAVHGDAPNPVPPLQAVGVMAVLEAALVAARTGHSIAPDVTPDERGAWVSGERYRVGG
ncbi:oxidoreductase [Neokomagataea thailandica]|uniref:Oxidoreductase n=1 Tax=Neokomagataea tanensis NBRC 106556 TaxID=1223519 RepID=A0ABQ0QG00_9PROT|nr:MULTISPECIES: oxidoreductase [Neokomagataea]GBR43344.1 oxidoreductase [Neokomagataea tanensis NBRC 106556]